MLKVVALFSVLFASQAFTCDVQFGYQCEEVMPNVGYYKRAYGCAGWGEVVWNLPETDKVGLFSSKRDCESFSEEADCTNLGNIGIKGCAEAGGEFMGVAGCFVCD